MKIAPNMLKAFALSGSALALLFVIGKISPVMAADGATPPAPTPAAINLPVSGMVTSPLPVPYAGGNMSGRSSRNLAPLEEKVTDAARSVVKQLSSMDSVNLDDLNTARQAVVKLDILIDIEKHLAELDKIHSDRSGEKSLAAAIPASALSAPPQFASAQQHTMPMAEMPAMMPSVHGEVSRISGADGHYIAVIQGKSVRVGDTLSDGSSVVAISAKEVSAKSKDGVVRHLKVKGIDQVYGHAL